MFDGPALRQQEFDRPARRLPPVKARCQDARVVQHEHRSGRQLVQNPSESQVLACARPPIHDHQAGVVAGVRGGGGDAVRR